jgi:hypothetical protein
MASDLEAAVDKVKAVIPWLANHNAQAMADAVSLVVSSLEEQRAELERLREGLRECIDLAAEQGDRPPEDWQKLRELRALLKGGTP